jgi:hypothetical protein
MSKSVPDRPDLDALRKRRRYRGKELLILGQVHRVEFRSDLQRLKHALGRKAIAQAQTISKGEIEITVEERDKILAYIEYLERHIDRKFITPTPLTTQQRRMVAIDVQAWAASTGLPKDGRSKKGVYQPWAAVQKLFPNNFQIEERTLNRLRDRPNYRAAFIERCSEALTLAVRKRPPK